MEEPVVHKRCLETRTEGINCLSDTEGGEHSLDYKRKVEASNRDRLSERCGELGRKSTRAGKTRWLSGCGGELRKVLEAEE